MSVNYTTIVLCALAVGLAAALDMWGTWRLFHRLNERIDDLEHRLDVGAAQSREALATYKLEVAKSYATVGLMKDVERRLTEHLVRIEVKLDAARQPD